MSARLVEILKKNSYDIELLKKEVSKFGESIKKLEENFNTNSLLINKLNEKAYFFDKYLEKIQSDDIKQLLEDEISLSTPNKAILKNDNNDDNNDNNDNNENIDK